MPLLLLRPMAFCLSHLRGQPVIVDLFAYFTLARQIYLLLLCKYW